MTGEMIVKLDNIADRAQGVSDLLAALSTAMEHSGGFEDGILLLANVSMQIAEELRAAQKEE